MTEEIDFLPSSAKFMKELLTATVLQCVPHIPGIRSCLHIYARAIKWFILDTNPVQQASTERSL